MNNKSISSLVSIMSYDSVKRPEEDGPISNKVQDEGENEFELQEWAASAVHIEPKKVRSKLRLIAVLLGLNVRSLPYTFSKPSLDIQVLRADQASACYVYLCIGSDYCGYSSPYNSF